MRRAWCVVGLLCVAGPSRAQAPATQPPGTVQQSPSQGEAAPPTASFPGAAEQVTQPAPTPAPEQQAPGSSPAPSAASAEPAPRQEAASVASAPPAPAPAGCPPGYVCTPADEAKPENERVHDGFYLRLGLGAALVSDHTEEPRTDTSGTFTGGALATELSLGGTVGSLVLLGGIYNHVAPSIGGSFETPTGSGRLEASDVSLYTLYGVGVDYYLDPRDGWHFGGVLGAGVLALEQGSTSGAPGGGISQKETLAGPGLLLSGGYDGWIGKQWSLGLSARVMAMTASDDTDRSHTVFIPAILGSALYH